MNIYTKTNSPIIYDFFVKFKFFNLIYLQFKHYILTIKLY